MAKELPYFKFEPSEWENGNIQICSMESKGLFIDVCSMYWSRLGELPEKLVIQKLCNSNANALQELCAEEILHINDGQIIIDFLDEQLNEFNETSEKRRKAANERWKNASAKQVQSKSNAIREEKIREEKKKVNKTKEKFTTPTLNEVKEYFKIKGYTLDAAKRAFDYYDSGNWKDSQGKKVKNWKQKMIAVWFKKENKIKQPEKEIHRPSTMYKKL